MSSSNDVHQSRWVEERLKALEGVSEFRPDVVGARGRLREREALAARRARRAWTTAAISASGTGASSLAVAVRGRATVVDRLTPGRVSVDD